MRNNSTFKQDLEDFIRDRIEESHAIILSQKDYKKLNKKYEILEEKFIKDLQNENKREYYYRTRDIKMELDYRELKQAYLTGFRDSVKIQNY